MSFDAAEDNGFEGAYSVKSAPGEKTPSSLQSPERPTLSPASAAGLSFFTKQRI
jgi:hypothetical protein